MVTEFTRGEPSRHYLFSDVKTCKATLIITRLVGYMSSPLSTELSQRNCYALVAPSMVPQSGVARAPSCFSLAKAKATLIL